MNLNINSSEENYSSYSQSNYGLTQQVKVDEYEFKQPNEF